MNYSLEAAAATGCELIVDLAGPFRLRDAQGADLTPRSRKAQGLLALVGSSPGLRRTRSWLQDKLWSDRAPEQGAASLRQCLTEIRSILREHPACFRTEAGWIAFDPDRVVVNTTPPDRDAGGDVEFLEGLDIRDPEFEHWLRDQRMSYSEGLDRSDVPKVKHQAAQEPGDFGAAWAAQLIQAHEAHIAALERLVCRQALELEQLKVARRSPRNGPISH